MAYKDPDERIFEGITDGSTMEHGEIFETFMMIGAVVGGIYGFIIGFTSHGILAAFAGAIAFGILGALFGAFIIIVLGVAVLAGVVWIIDFFTW